MKKKLFYLLLVVFATHSCSKEDGVIVGWEKVNSVAIGPNSVISIAISGANIYTLVSDYGMSLFKSADEGINWTKVTGIPQTVRSVSTWESYVYAGTSKGIYRSSDNGVTWMAVNTGLKTLTEAHTFIFNNQVYAYTVGDVYKDINNSGESWLNISVGLQSSPIKAFVVLGTSYFAATWEGIYRSNDGGVNWSIANANINNVQTLAVIGTTVIAGASNGLYYSADNGVNWTKAVLNNERDQSPWVECSVVSGKNIYVGAQNHGVYCSTDNGITWSAYNTGFSNTNIPSVWTITISGKYLYVGSDVGIWRRPI